MRASDAAAHVEAVAAPLREQLAAAVDRVAELEAALRPFLEAADETERHTGPWDGPAPHGITTWMADIGVWNKDVLAARAALKGKENDGSE